MLDSSILTLEKIIRKGKYEHLFIIIQKRKSIYDIAMG